MTMKLDSGQIAVIIGEWYRDEYGYVEAVKEFHRWADEQREDAYIEALEGAEAQLRLREDFYETCGREPSHIAGFRDARLRVQHAMVTLKAVYNNRSRFSKRDKAKNGQ